MKTPALFSMAVAFSAGILFVASCADTGPIGLKAALPQTRTGTVRTITLTNYFEFNPSHVSPRYHLPAGRYVATNEDANAIYFPAPSKILEKRIIGTFGLDGGLYVTKSSPHQLRVYCGLQPGEPTPIETFPVPKEFLEGQGHYWFVDPPFRW